MVLGQFGGGSKVGAACAGGVVTRDQQMPPSEAMGCDPGVMRNVTARWRIAFRYDYRRMTCAVQSRILRQASDSWRHVCAHQRLQPRRSV
jgi:hypothetical protein